MTQKEFIISELENIVFLLRSEEGYYPLIGFDISFGMFYETELKLKYYNKPSKELND